MKSINLSNIICSLIVAIAIIIGAVILQYPGGTSDTKMLNSEEVNQTNPLMTVKETADYLNLTESQVWIIIKAEAYNENQGMRFPAVKIEKDTYISTVGLVEWLQDSAIHAKEFN